MFERLFGKKKNYFVKVSFNKYPKYPPVYRIEGDSYNNYSSQYVYSTLISHLMSSIRCDIKAYNPNAHSITFVSIIQI